MKKIKEFIKNNERKIITIILIVLLLIIAITVIKHSNKPKNPTLNEELNITKIDKEYEEKEFKLNVEGLDENSTPFIVKAMTNGEEDIYAKGYDKIVLNLIKGKDYTFDIATAVNKDGSIYNTNVNLTDNVKINKIANPTKEQIEESLNKIAEFAKNIEDTKVVEKATENIKNNETLPEEAKKEIETQMEEKKQEVERVVETKVQERKYNNNQVQKPVVSVQEKPNAEVKPAPKPEPKPTPAPQPKSQPKPENKPAEKPKQKVWVETRAAKPAVPAKYKTVSYVNENPNKEAPNDTVIKVRNMRTQHNLLKYDRSVVLDSIIIESKEEWKTKVKPRIRELILETGGVVHEIEVTLNKDEYKHTYQKEISPAKPAVPAEGHWEWR